MRARPRHELRPRRDWLLLVASTALAACSPAAGTDVEAPLPPVGNFLLHDEAPPTAVEVALTRFLQARHGVHADARTLWFEGAGEVQHRVCAQATPAPGLRDVAVCHVGGAYGNDGRVDFFRFAEAGGALRELAVGHRVAAMAGFSGSHSIRVLRSGAQQVAFVLREEPAGTAEDADGTATLVAFVDGGLATLAEGRSSLWDACPSGLPCDNGEFVAFDYAFETRDAAAPAYPLLVSEKGSECGVRIDRAHRIEYDATARAYPLPAPLTRHVANCDGGSTPTGAPDP